MKTVNGITDAITGLRSAGLKVTEINISTRLLIKIHFEISEITMEPIQYLEKFFGVSIYEMQFQDSSQGMIFKLEEV